ncbi:MAG: ABC transporter substrate-binding protein, partial [Rhodospirillales bacterium]|nr:ABC transporter substrate-binding protein [Rhodospirillales bacterium]
GGELGRHGGTLKTLMGRQKDIRMITVYGYGRLVGYNRKLEFTPDILESLDVVENRIFTLRIRKGHRWSDGHLFTAEDFRYFWEDIANNKKLSPFGPSKTLLVDGEPPRFEILDPLTVRYSWSKPNPYFLAELAGARPLYIYRPAHYLKKYHPRYVEPEKLARMIKKAHARNWAVLHTRKDHQYRFDNPKLPTLQPWRNTTKRPARRFVFKRNPYYHRIDAAGRQLPYLDQLVVNIASGKLVPTKAGVGESDLQARHIRFDNYTFLKEGEKQHGYKVLLWRAARGSKFTVYPNLNVEDPTWQTLLRDARFRRALSLGINRHEINQVVFFGLAREGANTVLKESPLFKPEYLNAWAKFDLKAANKLLDEIGLTKRDDNGLRLLPDGRAADVIIDTAGESTLETDVLELIHDSWLKLGIELHARPSQREVFRNRVFAGLAVMSVWSGLENGIPSPDMSPGELAPTSQQQLQWSKWGQYYESSHKVGLKSEMPIVLELSELNEAWRRAKTREKRAEIWHRMLRIHADQIFTIGVISGVLQPIVVKANLRNVPVEGIYNFDPGAYFGIYRPETFWFGDKK